MAETQLITLSEISTYRHVDPTFNADKLNAFIDSIQKRNLRDLFGDKMYYAFMADDRTSGKYKELLDGKTYIYDDNIIQYYGLKPMLCFWALAVLMRESETNISYHGAVEIFDNPQQQFKPAKEKERLAVGYMAEASKYANEVIRFLDEHSSTYTLWDSHKDIDSVEFLTFKI